MRTRTQILADIEQVEDTMKQLVVQQLGDKFGYDSSLNDLDRYVGANTKLAANESEPLEGLIRGALNYDSLAYREAL